MYLLFKESPLLAGLDENEGRSLLELSLKQSFAGGDILFWEGQEAKGFYLIVSGQVKIYKTSPEGKEQILRVFGPGEPVGEVAVFSGGTYPANAQALQETQSLYLPRDRFVEWIMDNPQRVMNLLGALCHRLLGFTRLVEDLSLREVSARLARYLVEQAGEGEEIRLMVAKNQLAAEMGTISETLSRTFAKLRERGLIRMEQERIWILDRERLDLLAQGERLT